MLENITKKFVAKSQEILLDNLVGIYLHGSAVMGCFNEKKSDIDLLIVVNKAITNEVKRKYMDMVVELNTYAPEKGIEMSIVKGMYVNRSFIPRRLNYIFLTHIYNGTKKIPQIMSRR